MYVLRGLYAFLALSSVACIAAGIKQKRSNIGFLITAALITACDFVCILLLGVTNVKSAGGVFLPYYILHSWMLFAILLMIIMVDRYRSFIVGNVENLRIE